MTRIILISFICCWAALSRASETGSPDVSIDVSHVRVSWASQSNRFYQVQYRSVSTTNLWADLGFTIGGNGEALFMNDVVAGPQRTYRIVVPTNAAIVTNMVWIHPGTFTLGTPVNDSLPGFHEGPQTVVTISRGFWMGAFEVTQREYLDVTGQNPSYFLEPSLPVNNVCWNDATNYCVLLTARERAAGRISANFRYRLPTEAEWEYACRAGTTTRFSFGNDVDSYSQLPNFAWYAGNSTSQIHSVGHKRPNPWGLYDMHGNVWEWCQNWYAQFYPGGSVSDPTGPVNGSERPLRGGCWFNEYQHCRSASRNHVPPAYANVDYGFRVVLSLDVPSP